MLGSYHELGNIMKNEASALNFPWRILYTLGLLSAVLTVNYGSGGWLGLATGTMPTAFSIPTVALLALVAGRIIWVWLRPQVLTWPTAGGLRALAKASLVVSLLGVIGIAVMFGYSRSINSLPVDVRGAAGLVFGLFLLPVFKVGGAAPVVFEWARGWSARSLLATGERAVLRYAGLIGVILAVAPLVSNTLFPIDNLVLARYAGTLSWVVLALALGSLIVIAPRDTTFPASAVFSSVLVGYFVGAVVVLVATTFLAARIPTFQTAFVVWASLLSAIGLAVGGAPFALVLAVIAATVVGVIRPRTAGPVSLSARLLAAVLLAAATAWLGIWARTNALRPVPTYVRDRTLSTAQLMRQTEHLRRRCPEAGINVMRTQAGVAQLEIRYPDRPTLAETHTSLYPDQTRPHNWYPMRGTKPGYKLLVFSKDGKRRAYMPDTTQSFGYNNAQAHGIDPRYVLTWKELQTPAEAADGVVGNEMTVIDTQDASVMARSVLFFSRTNGHFGSYREACGTLAQGYNPDTYDYDWVTQILVPER